MITKEDLLAYFEQLRNERDAGKTDFDIDHVCRWSYFFTDTVRSNLTRIGLHLEDHGYQIRGFLEAAPDDPNPKTLYIRADRIEKHTVDSLYETNLEFYALVEKMGVLGYDGMDVGAIGSP